MGLEVLNNRKIYVKENNIEDFKDSDISKLIIPFSILFGKKVKPDIYSGEESIIFTERNSEFQQILLYEFL